MTVDKVKLKALAEALKSVDTVSTEKDCETFNAFYKYITPDHVLSLLAEIEQDEMHLRAFSSVAETAIAERDQLKAKLAELEAIGELINSQDNRCTDQPMFAVMEKRGILTLDTHDHDRIEWVETESGDYCEADETKARRLEALHQGHRDTPGWERYAIKDVDVFVTACFTEQGCKDFLARDGHNHRKPFIYAFGSYRNGEYQTVRNWLKSLPKKMGD